MLPIRDHNPSRKTPYITIIFIVINIFVFLMELAAPDTEQFIRQYALIPVNIDLLNISSLTRFISSMFMHAGFAHIGSNMLFLWIFGDNVEADWGHFRYLLVYLFWGVSAALAQYSINPGSDIPMLGASGAVAGVLGSYLVLHPSAKIETLIVGFFGLFQRVNIPAYFMLGYWFITQFFSGTASIVTGTASIGGVAFFAHIGGFIAGYSTSKLKR
jgi:membrane associated rhomboid family serine protease